MKNLIFDMYGVILEESKGNFIPYTFVHFEKSEHARLIKQLKEEQLFTKAGNGEISSYEFLSALGYDNPDYHMKNYIENHLTLDKGFITFAEKYYQVFDFALLSNDVAEWSSHITKYYDLNKYFKHKIVSGEVKCRKPDRQIYEIALQQISCTASECIFVDNSVANLITAAELGITPVLFNRDGENYDGLTVNTFEELEGLLKTL